MISYVFVAETELMNIVTLIEGTRYELDNKLHSHCSLNDYLTVKKR